MGTRTSAGLMRAGGPGSAYICVDASLVVSGGPLTPYLDGLLLGWAVSQVMPQDGFECGRPMKVFSAPIPVSIVPRIVTISHTMCVCVHLCVCIFLKYSAIFFSYALDLNV